MSTAKAPLDIARRRRGIQTLAGLCARSAWATISASSPGRIGLIVVSLLPPAVTAWILWGAPIEGLAADRTALAARDFTALWAAGHLALDHATATLFSPTSFTAALRTEFGPDVPEQIWPYPPPVLLIAAPISLLPLSAGFAVWTLTTAALLALALRSAELPAQACVAVLLSPAVAANALAGQNGALTAALLLSGLALLDRRPAIAGALLGALLIKPQFAFLVPLCLIAGRRWHALAVGALTVLCLALLPCALFGAEVWVDYVLRTRPALTTLLAAPWDGRPAQLIFASPFMAARSVGASAGAAVALQAAVSLLCAVLAWRAWRISGPVPRCRLATTLALCLAASPWTHSYDMPALAAALLLLLPVSRSAWPALGVAWVWPGMLALLPAPPLLATLSVGSIARVAVCTTAERDPAWP